MYFKIIISNKSIWTTDGTLTGTTTLGQSGAEQSRGDFILSKAPKLKSHYQMQFSDMHRTCTGHADNAVDVF